MLRFVRFQFAESTRSIGSGTVTAVASKYRLGKRESKRWFRFRTGS